MEHELVGAGHQGAVELLEQRLQSIRTCEPVPRVVVLEGESGVGKTRIGACQVVCVSKLVRFLDRSGC